MFGQGHGSLFDRLDAPASNAIGRRLQPCVHQQVLAIKRHIEQVLNTRQGASQSSPGTGLPDFNDATTGSADLLLRATVGIREAIERSEPRVRVLAIRLSKNDAQPMHLCFRLECELWVDTPVSTFELDLVLNRSTRRYSTD